MWRLCVLSAKPAVLGHLGMFCPLIVVMEQATTLTRQNSSWGQPWCWEAAFSQQIWLQELGSDSSRPGCYWSLLWWYWGWGPALTDLQSLLDLPTGLIFGRWLFFWGVAGNLVSSVPQAYSIFLIFSKQKATAWFIVYGVWWGMKRSWIPLTCIQMPHPYPVTVDWWALFSVSVSVSME